MAAFYLLTNLTMFREATLSTCPVHNRKHLSELECLDCQLERAPRPYYPDTELYWPDRDRFASEPSDFSDSF